MKTISKTRSILFSTENYFFPLTLNKSNHKTMIYDDLQAAADSNGSSWLHCRLHSLSGFYNDVVEFDLPLCRKEMENYKTG